MPVLVEARRVVVSAGVAPAMLSIITRGGPQRFVEEWTYDHADKQTAAEIVADYAKQNKTREHIASEAVAGLPTADLSAFEKGRDFNWTPFSASYPRIQSVIVLSRPAVDSLGSTALAHFDVITPTMSWTAFYFLQKQNGAWTIGDVVVGDSATMYLPDIHTHPPAQCKVPRKKPAVAKTKS